MTFEKQSGHPPAQSMIADKIEQSRESWRTSIARERDRVFLLATENAKLLGKLSSRDREHADLVRQLAERALTLDAERQTIRDYANQLMRLGASLAEARDLKERQDTELRILSALPYVRLRKRVLSLRRLISRAKRRLFLRARPNPLFDDRYYLERYPDVAFAGIDPYLHYLLSGAAEGRNPNAMFDTRWYIERYPDVRASGMNPLSHYHLYGAAELRDPHPLFSTRWYVEQTAGTRSAGMNPLEHFLKVSQNITLHHDDAGANG